VIPAWLISLASPALAGSIAGAVLDDGGDPVAGATIAAINPWFSATRTTTGIDGSYRLTGLAAGEYRVAAVPTAGDPRLVRYHPSDRSYCDGLSVRLYEDTARTGVDLTLPRGASIQGQLLDLDGLPLDGAGVTAVPVGDIPAQRTATTDEEGWFHIRGLDVADGGDKEWRIKAAVSGWPVQWLGQQYDEADGTIFTVGKRGTTQIGGHALLDGILVSGQVSDAEGPVPDATVRVYSSGQLIQSTTDSLGRYSVVGLPPGEVIPWAAAEGRGVTYLPDHDRPMEALLVDEGELAEDGDIQMPGEARFSVQLTAPIQADFSEISILLYNDTHTVGRGATADAEGQVTIDQLHGGSYHLFVYAADAGLADTWIRDADGGLVVFTVDDETFMPPVEVALTRSVRIEGEVIDEEGLPVANAAVLASPPDDSELSVSDNSFFTHTDGTGRFTLAGLPTGSWQVRTYVDPRCPSDSGYVPIFWPQRVNPSQWESVDLSPDDNPYSIRFELPQDDDHDQMGDRWEQRHRLDTTTDDSAGDPDNDGLSNLEEYRTGRDPHVRNGTWVTVNRCGCASAPGPRLPWLVPLLFLILRRRDDVPTC
jgi:hypothetical protein